MAYNLKPVIAILGIQPFMAAIRAWEGRSLLCAETPPPSPKPTERLATNLPDGPACAFSHSLGG